MSKDKIVARVYFCAWSSDMKNFQTNTFKDNDEMYNFIEAMEANIGGFRYATVEQDVLQEDVDDFEARK